MHAGHLDIAPELAGNRAGPGQHSHERNLVHPAIQVRTNLSQVRARYVWPSYDQARFVEAAKRDIKKLVEGEAELH